MVWADLQADAALLSSAALLVCTERTLPYHGLPSDSHACGSVVFALVVLQGPPQIGWYSASLNVQP